MYYLRSICSQSRSGSFPCFALCHSGADPTGSFLGLLCQLGYKRSSRESSARRLETSRKGHSRAFLSRSNMSSIFRSSRASSEPSSHRTCLSRSQLPPVTLNPVLQYHHLLLLPLQPRHGSAFLSLLSSVVRLHPLFGLSVLPFM